jgi:hypothetical protein
MAGMTEEQWLSWSDGPELMLLRVRQRATDRQVRLFGCACCRLLWEHLDEWARQAVEAGERHADGLLSETELAIIRRACNQALGPLRGVRARLGQAAAELVRPRLSYVRAYRMTQLARTGREEQVRSLLARHCDLLRDVFGNPFRPVVRIDPLWRSSNDGIVVKLARAAHEERNLPAGTLDNVRLAMLADALEDVGCDVVEVLTHLRGGGDHWRGCWVLDRLLDPF